MQWTTPTQVGYTKTWDECVITCANYDADHSVFTLLRAPVTCNTQEEMHLDQGAVRLTLRKCWANIR
jgi:hypothetical protein